MNYGFVTIKVKNMEESLKFYTEVIKLNVTRQFSPQPGISIAFLADKANNAVELIEHANAPKVEVVEGLVSIGFKVGNIEETVEMLKEKNIPIVMGPISVPSGEKFVYIKDPNGVDIEFIEGMGL